MSDSFDFLFRSLSFGLTMFGLYELQVSLGMAPIVTVKIEGRDIGFQLASLKGFFRRLISVQSVVKFATGTGVYLKGRKRFFRQNVSFPVDVVFLDKKGVIISIAKHMDGGRTTVKNKNASALFVVNGGEASELQVGQTVIVLATNGAH